MIEGAATKYTAVMPEEFCMNRIRLMEEMKDRLMDNMPVKNEEPEGYITIRGEKHILDKIKNMIMGAYERIYISTSIKILDEVTPELKIAISRGP